MDYFQLCNGDSIYRYTLRMIRNASWIFKKILSDFKQTPIKSGLLSIIGNESGFPYINRKSFTEKLHDLVFTIQIKKNPRLHYWPVADKTGDKLVDYIGNCVWIGMLTVLDAGNLDGVVGGDGDRFSVQTMVYWFFYLLLKPVRHCWWWHCCCWWPASVDRLSPGHPVRNSYET